MSLRTGSYKKDKDQNSNDVFTLPKTEADKKWAVKNCGGVHTAQRQTSTQIPIGSCVYQYRCLSWSLRLFRCRAVQINILLPSLYNVDTLL